MPHSATYFSPFLREREREREANHAAASVTSVATAALHLVARLVADEIPDSLQILALHSRAAPPTETPHQAGLLAAGARTLVTPGRTKMRLG